jgi:4-carboxymuconolactone decarboxylase
MTELKNKGEEKMKRLLTLLTIAASLALAPAVRADEITRFLPMKAEQLNPEQKKWADLISAPPRNAKFVNPPYRAYITNPDLANRLSALSEYLRWNTLAAPAPERTRDPDHGAAMDRAV